MVVKKILLGLVLLTSFSAFSSTETWDFDEGVFNGSSYGNSFVVEGDGGNTLTITGWSDTGGDGDDLIEATDLDYSSSYGLSMYNADEEDCIEIVCGHSIDNYGDDTDMALLAFEEAISLEEFSIGWAYEETTSGSGSETRADVTVLAYTGSGEPDISGSTWEDLLASGWEVVGNYANVDDYNSQSVDTDVVSQYWLVGAFDRLFGSIGNGLNDGSSREEGFKLTALAGDTVDPTDVSEPSALALLGLGLVGMYLRRRKIQF